MLVQDLLIILGFTLCAILFSFTTNLLLLKFSHNLGIRNSSDVLIRWSNQSKPSLGGISFFAVFIFSAIAYSILFSSEGIFDNNQYVGLFVAGCLAFAMGLADDAYNTKPLPKLFAQISCGLLLFFTGSAIELSEVYWINCLVTVVWVVGVMNSLNMLDNMDGITGTTVLFILLSCLASSFIVFHISVSIWTITIFCTIGAIVGFLFFNLHPSKMFMGDTGSQFLALIVAFFGIKFLWNTLPDSSSSAWATGLLTLTVFTPAAADTLTVVINRLRKGKSPMVGGKDHTTHHMVYAGFNDRQVWWGFTFFGLFSFLIAIAMLYLINNRNSAFLALFGVYFLAVFGYLYRNTIKFPERKK
jgi:UDP-GlcNAc:undecaprenyl-phosphate GlcNAc-1-phosphate transferase